ncbi:MAG: acyl carrier protein [Algoriphagus aquaeductus]|jgi:acyl carrier protein|uniref:Acyl carrier protein n=1 Tax=Algoriphagus aquaeductus TaxID=475299 RepID=A0A326RWE4_9BACT|nr:MULTISPECIES: acyl carrier protein [Algoriphagus]PZV85510.1 acyl carrier protein [Algoriphagus aquaeductus]
MKNHLKKTKILISVFQEFGIPITGKRKFKQFYSEIPVDRFYVEGILFELESRLGVLLEDEENSLIQSPLDVIMAFKSKALA